MTKEQATVTNYDGLWGREIKAEAERKQRMKEPTPRPWTWLLNEGQFIVDKDRNIVAEVPCTSGNPADGAFIVTAVNERDALLSEVATLRTEALKGICVYCGYIEQYESLEQKASEEGNAIRVAHIRQCEARPEAKLIVFSQQLIDEVARLREALEEVREVLPLLRRSDSDNCWCDGRNPHATYCQRARALMEKLEVGP